MSGTSHQDDQPPGKLRIAAPDEIPERNLTARQAKFVERYLVTLNASLAYKEAGYTGQGNVAEAAASRLLRSVKVKTAIEQALQARSERTAIDQNYVLTRLKQEAELEGGGSSHSARVRALEILAKHVNLLPNHQQIDINARIEHQLVEMDLSQLPLLARRQILDALVRQRGENGWPTAEAELPLLTLENGQYEIP